MLQGIRAGTWQAAATAVRTHNAGPSQTISGVDTGRSAGAWFYWVRVTNRSGFPSDRADLSGTAGPFPVTVT